MGSSSSKKKGGGSYPKQEMSGGENQGYPQQPNMGYPPPQQPGGYPPQHQPMGYPPQQEMGYPPQPGYPPEHGGYPPQQGYGDMGYPPQHEMGYGEQQPHLTSTGQPLDNVGREESACQYQFQPGDETYRCLDCEITDDVPSNIFVLFW